MTITACGSDTDSVVGTEPVDFIGTWSSSCKLADTSVAFNLGDVYYHDELEITETRISAGSLLFSDSDCVTSLLADFARAIPFAEGEYVLGEVFTSESGLTAVPIEIAVVDSGDIIDNIIALVDETLYFGYNPLNQPSGELQFPLRALDLEGGFRRR